eukprot:scaffold182810_cov23-Cyclotella_meneghiniana.AAC.1
MIPSRHLRTTAILLLCSIDQCDSWQKWNYTSFANDNWKEFWSTATGPNARRGHTMVVFNESKVVLFGGRGNDAHRPHVPSRYNIVEDRGLLEFSTYDEHPLSSVFDPQSEFCQPVQTCVSLTDASSGNEEVCSYSWQHLTRQDLSHTEQTTIEEMCGFVPVGVYYNDVWEYDTECLRFADHECAQDGWRILHNGIVFGGCSTNDAGEKVCEAPSERYGHGAAMLDEKTM